MAVYVKGKDGTLLFEASAEVDHGNNIRFEAKSYLGKGVHVARTLTVEQGRELRDALSAAVTKAEGPRADSRRD
jgi:hypothetical protein